MNLNKRISEEHSNCQIYKENRIENDYKNYYEVIDRISRYVYKVKEKKTNEFKYVIIKIIIM